MPQSLTTLPARLHCFVMSTVLSRVLTTILSTVLLSTPVLAQPAATAAIAMPDAHAADTAEHILRAGGNAVDAAVAAAFSLAVTYPEAGNIGGGGFATVWFAGEANFLDFREMAPAAAQRDMYLDERGEFLSRQALVGARASGVPGTVDGLQQLHERYGVLPWTTLLQPAIELAREGFVVPEALAALRDETSVFLNGETNFDAHFSALQTGHMFRQPALAATLERIADDPADFYAGETAGLLLAQMQRSGGLITGADLRAYRSVWREPLIRSWRGFSIIAPPPPSSGGIALIQLLAMRDLRDDLFAGSAHNSARYLHLLAELEKRVFADRAEYLGDPDFVEVPTRELLAPDYLAGRAAQINPSAISPADAVPPGLESADTTHFSILDSDGNAISLTYTLNWDFGSGVVVEGAGFLLNNEMDDFSAKVGAQNIFGVVGSRANAIAPGKRMVSSMTPTLGLRDGEIALVIGSPGGSTIFTSVFQTLLNLYDFAMPAVDAVAAMRFHHQLPAAQLIRHDARPVPAATRTGLEAMGYSVEVNSWGDMGDVQLIVRRGSVLEAAADPRGRGEARLLELVPDIEQDGEEPSDSE